VTVEQLAKQIESKQKLYAAATRIRMVLDESRAAYGADEFDADDCEAAILELVQEECS